MPPTAKTRTITDVERGPKGGDLAGYARYASLTAGDEEKSGAIFDIFDEPATRNLLYMERRLARNVERQRQLDFEDEQDLELKLGATSLDYFDKDLAFNDRYNTRYEERKKLAEEIKQQISEYHSALCLHSQVLSLPRPTQRTLEAWSKETRHTINDGSDRLASDRKYALRSLKEQRERDPMSNILLKYFPGFFARQSLGGGVLDVSSKRIANTVSVLATVLAFGLLFAAIEVLYREPSHGKRVGYLAGFIMAFAIAVRLFTGAKRSEIFAATAAYAAVLIVYVGETKNKDRGAQSAGS